MREIDWLRIWEDVARTIANHVSAGRTHLLTEDVVRFAAIVALGDQQVDASRIGVEHRVVEIGSIDMVIDPPTPTAAVEFKFPRDPRVLNAADTMTYGELLKDFYRLSRLAIPESWVVQVVPDRLGRYLERRTEVRWPAAQGDAFRIDVGTVARLPLTARRLLPEWAEALSVVTSCMAVHPLVGRR